MGKRRKMVVARTALLAMVAVSNCFLGFSNQDGFHLRFGPRSIRSDSDAGLGTGPQAQPTKDEANRAALRGRFLGVRIPANSSSVTISTSQTSSAAPETTTSDYVDPFLYPPDISNGSMTTVASDVPSGGNQPTRLTDTTSTSSATVRGPPSDDTASISKPQGATPPKPTKKPPVIPTRDPTTGLDITTDLNIQPTRPAEDPNQSPSSSSSSTPTPTSANMTSSTIEWTYVPPGWTAPWEGAAPSKTYCGSSDWAKPTTRWIMVYTETITWTKDPKEFVGPTEEPEPTTCVEYTREVIRNTLTRCQSTKGDPEETTTEGWKTCQTTVTEYKPIDLPNITGPQWGQSSTVTVVATAKNPTVVFSSHTAPDYGGGDGNPKTVDHNPGSPHAPETMSEDTKPNQWGGDGGGGGQKQTATPSLTVTVNQEHVVIDKTTFHNNPTAPTQTVTVGSNTITIDPTKVAGENFVVTRSPVPAGAAGAVFAPQPTTTNIGGVAVTVSAGIAVVDGTTFNLSPTMTSAALGNGQTVTFGPLGVMIDGQTVAVSHYPAQTSVVVAGGEVLTAIGPSVVVIRGTTITYGPGSSSLLDINGDLITAGPMGVTLHGSVIGGYTNPMSASIFELVGGATITQLGQSLVVIKGTTYSVGPGAPSTVLTVGSQTITLGPAGVTVATVTFSYPFGSTTTVVPGQVATATGVAAQTSKDAAPEGSRPSLALSIVMTCIAIGVRVFGILL